MAGLKQGPAIWHKLNYNATSITVSKSIPAKISIIIYDYSFYSEYPATVSITISCYSFYNNFLLQFL